MTEGDRIDGPVPTRQGPILEFDNARIDDAGGVLAENLNGSVRAARVALLGDWSPLYRLLRGTARLSGGRILIGGIPAKGALLAGAVGLAPASLQRDAAWTAQRYLATARELSGKPPKTATDQSHRLLDRYGLRPLAARPMSQLRTVELRAISLARALILDPPVLIAETPFAGLDDPSAEWLALLLEHAVSERALLVSLQAPQTYPAEHSFLAGAETALEFRTDGLCASAPQEFTHSRHRYSVTLLDQASAFVEALQGHGCTVISRSAASISSNSDAAMLVLELETPENVQLVWELSSELRAPITELRPLE